MVAAVGHVQRHYHYARGWAVYQEEGGGVFSNHLCGHQQLVGTYAVDDKPFLAIELPAIPLAAGARAQHGGHMVLRFVDGQGHALRAFGQQRLPIGGWRRFLQQQLRCQHAVREQGQGSQMAEVVVWRPVP